jgi:hypothetical protein
VEVRGVSTNPATTPITATTIMITASGTPPLLPPAIMIRSFAQSRLLVFSNHHPSHLINSA